MRFSKTRILGADLPASAVAAVDNDCDDGAAGKRKAGVDLGAENANKKQFKEEDMDDAAKAVLQDANRFLEGILGV